MHTSSDEPAGEGRPSTAGPTRSRRNLRSGVLTDRSTVTVAREVSGDGCADGGTLRGLPKHDRGHVPDRLSSPPARRRNRLQPQLSPRTTSLSIPDSHGANP